MHAWEPIQKTIEYIEGHLDESFEMEQLAEMANLSVFYYQRLFSKLVKRPVMEYIRLRRLARASEMLAGEPGKVLDVALTCGFGSHEVFSRAFKEAYGITPEQYRRNPIYLNQFDKPDLSLNYTIVEEGMPLISEGMILELNWKDLKEEISFIGLEGYVPVNGQMPVGEGTGADLPGVLWSRFHSEKHRIAGTGQKRELGVAWLGDAPEGSFTYFTGLESAADTEPEDGFTKWELPAGRYLICSFEAENFTELTTVALNKALKYCLVWMEKKGLSSKTYAPEMYYDSSPEGTYMELWISAE